MRAIIACLALLGVVAGVSAAGAAVPERPHAQLLLDLDLLRESDPRLQRQQPVIDHMQLLEFLRRLQSPAGAKPAPDGRPTPKEAC